MAPNWKKYLRWFQTDSKTTKPATSVSSGVSSPPTAAPSSEKASKARGRPASPTPQASARPSTLQSSEKVKSVPRRRASRPVAAGRSGRNGIPVLPSDSDLERLFLSRESDGVHDGPTPSAAQAARPHSSADRQSRDRSASRQPQQKPITNRHGLPLLSANDNLDDHFVGTDDVSSDTARARPPVHEDPDGCDRKDKNGIPVLDHCEDLARLFTASTDETRPDDQLADAFKRSLASDAHTMIKRKTDGIYPVRKLTLQERLKRYPRPQKQLDLHGATAPRAEQRADSFVRTAHADGLFTLRIIVGKGLHSEAGAVLPDVVEDRLIHLKQEGLVMTHRWEKGLKRKSGAVLVYLESPFY